MGSVIEPKGDNPVPSMNFMAHAIIQIAGLAMFDARQNLPFRCTVAFQLIGDDESWET
jgi:hypothetical protein